MPSFPCRRPNGHGYTLLELLIVVAVMLVVASLTLPSLYRPFEKSKLRDAAKQLRVALARARLEAIESGTAWQFRYQPGTGWFEIAARSTFEGGGGFTPVSSEGFDEVESAADQFAPSQPEPDELPEGVRFFGPFAPHAPPAEPDLTTSYDEASWSAPIVFYPNGRTFNARIRLVGQYNYYVDVTLRGLTGASRVGRVERFEDPLEESFQTAPEESL